ncbi:helix-turn-helix domain-containing protein [Haladaptatus sp. DFWS20]|uniref:helix-turn-helix domain-containing protein n=1 Tax=Haladaptatus sp. DFWS20 TaxID=3403467 RepID=UPI003EBC2F38
MSIIAEFTIDSEEFIFGTVMAQVPNSSIELERIVPTSNAVMPFFWVESTEFPQFEMQVREDLHVDDLVELDRIDDHRLYRAVWSEEVDPLLEGLAQTEAVVLEGYGHENWVFRVRFQSHDRLAEFYNYLTANDIILHLDRVFSLTSKDSGGYTLGLTPEQREALVMAYERGYFATPSEITLQEMADELNISSQAFSKRIRGAELKMLDQFLNSMETDATD